MPTNGEAGNRDLDQQNENQVGLGPWLGHIVRFVVSALVLMGVGLIVPGFSRMTFGTALFAAIVIALLGFIIETIGGSRFPLWPRAGWFYFFSSGYLCHPICCARLRVSIIGALLGH